MLKMLLKLSLSKIISSSIHCLLFYLIFLFLKFLFSLLFFHFLFNLCTNTLHMQSFVKVFFGWLRSRSWWRKILSRVFYFIHDHIICIFDDDKLFMILFPIFVWRTILCCIWMIHLGHFSECLFDLSRCICPCYTQYLIRIIAI